MGGNMEYGITFPRGGVAEQPSPWKYLTNMAREAEQMGCAYCVIGDRLESGLDPFSADSTIPPASTSNRPPCSGPACRSGSGAGAAMLACAASRASPMAG